MGTGEVTVRQGVQTRTLRRTLRLRSCHPWSGTLLERHSRCDWIYMA